jgi:beta-lactamase class A
MNHFHTRRAVLLALAAAPFARAGEAEAPAVQFAELEETCGGWLGVAALNTADGTRLLHRADENFPVCSTFKMMLAAKVLQRSALDASLLARRIRYGKGELVSWSPVTEQHVGEGMTVGELCRAALQRSDNSAANLLMKMVGGPSAVTAYARSIGDSVFRLDRWETELNSAIPGDLRDTTTPQAMMASVHRLLVENTLGDAQREQLKGWMLGNLTGDERIRAGVPAGWQVADKTGTGDYGTVNDVGVIWPPGRAPIVLAIYLTHPVRAREPRNDVIAAATRIVATAFA